MKPGDEVTSDLPVLSVVLDADGDAWIRRENGWTFGRMRKSWAELRAVLAPLTLASLPSGADPEWEPVDPEDVRVGDEIEFVRRYGTTVHTVRGTVRVTEINATEGDGVVDLDNYRCVNLREGDLRRRVRPAMPEPGVGAVVEVDGHRWARKADRDSDGWVDLSEECLSWSTWAGLLATGTPTVLLPAATS